MKFGTVALPPYKAFSLDHIVEAANNFDVTNFMGEASQRKERYATFLR